MRVLIVGDDPAVIGNLRGALRQEGDEVLVQQLGDGLVEPASSPGIALVVLDPEGLGLVMELLARVHGLLRQSSLEPIKESWATASGLAGWTILAVAGRRVDGPGRLEPLTIREREVVALLAAGLRNGEMARRLGVAEKTVEFHMAHVLAKLGARSRTEAVLNAIRQGIVAGTDDQLS